jgi:hypothetical protein
VVYLATLTITASRIASFDSVAGWFDGTMYVGETSTRRYYGAMWFSSSDIDTIRNTVGDASCITKVELYAKRNSTAGGTTPVELSVGTMTRDYGDFRGPGYGIDNWGYPSASPASFYPLPFSKGQGKW